ncbi:MAG: hypothetical protein JOY80_05165 [Candidatus Dormibacteraeota bacterium]|nr:hypothetical protein [Candidatus Dormibacteraeota bacterium]
MIQRPPISWAVGFVRFWYHFIVGDDWTLAAAVVVGLATSAVLLRRGIVAWWLVPALVIVTVWFDLRRASGSRH